MSQRAEPFVPRTETAIYELGQVIGIAGALQHSLLFLAAEECDEKRLADLIAAAKRASTALGVTLWEEDEE